MSDHLSVGILGATGAVGQKLVALLSGHPWFRVTALAGSERSRGKAYKDGVRWMETTPLPEWARGLELQAPSPSLPCDLVFSALSAKVADEVEQAFVGAGTPVFSNARSFRMAPEVPLLIPEVNPDHIEILRGRPPENGFIVANPNCSTTGLVLALAPLEKHFGVRRVSVTTLQAISGAGYPGVPSLDISGNVIPHIPGEEDKLESEPLKILGTRVGSAIRSSAMTISAQTNRVPVVDGHLLSVSVELDEQAEPSDLIEAWENFGSPLAALGLPSAPDHPIHFSLEPDFPQPRIHGLLGKGMVVGIGRLRRCPVLGFRFVALVHNTIRGAAGGAILNAELLKARGFLRSLT
jgi:aspartate-semialdehyde dehydrogenase